MGGARGGGDTGGQGRGVSPACELEGWQAVAGGEYPNV